MALGLKAKPQQPPPPAPELTDATTPDPTSYRFVQTLDRHYLSDDENGSYGIDGGSSLGAIQLAHWYANEPECVRVNLHQMNLEMRKGNNPNIQKILDTFSEFGIQPSLEMSMRTHNDEEGDYDSSYTLNAKFVNKLGKEEKFPLAQIYNPTPNLCSANEQFLHGGLKVSSDRVQELWWHLQVLATDAADVNGIAHSAPASPPATAATVE